MRTKPVPFHADTSIGDSPSKVQPDANRETEDRTTGLPVKRKFHYTRSQSTQKRTCLGAEAVDMHAVWYSRSPLQPASNGDTTFRKELAKSYLGLVDGMHGTPGNMQAQLWTDRKSLKALYTPVVQNNGVEIEIPHSMIDHKRTKVAVRCEQDLLAMMDAIQDDGLRQTLEKLYFHPARVNIGFLADVVRAIVTQAHLREGTFYRRMNVYTDRDTMADVALQRDHAAAGGEGDPPEGLEAAKLSLRAMQKPRPGLTDATVPDELEQYGYAINGRENDVMAAVPGHERPRSVARKMLQTLDELKYTRPGLREKEAADGYARGLERSIAYFRSLKSGNEHEPRPAHIDPEEALRAFTLAERVRSLRPVLQARIEALEREAQNTMDDARGERCIAEAASLRAVYRNYNDHTEYFVNLCSYLPQTGLQIACADASLRDFYDHVYQAVPRAFDGEGGWKGELGCTLQEVDEYTPTWKQQVQAHAVILRLLKDEPPRET